MSAAKTISPAAQQTGVFVSPEKRNLIACLLLAVVTLGLYNPVNHHPFVNYDDDRYVTENPHVRQGLTLDTVKWALTSTEQANWHPLTWISHALDYSLFRLNAAGHHFTSLVIHAVNVVLLFLLLMWSTGRFGPSLFVAALFAVHPIEVESVAWVAERKNVLCTMFFFLTLCAYGWYARNPGWKRYLMLALLFAAGLAAKPMAITLPFVLLLLDYWPLNRVSRNGRGEPHTYSWPRLVFEKLPLLTLSAGSAIITMHAQRVGGAVRAAIEFPFHVRLENAIVSYALYLWNMLWPLRLAPLYPHPGDSLSWPRVVIAALVLSVLTTLVLKFREQRYLLVGWLWFVGTLIPVIGLVQVGEAAMADRYAYIPLIGVFAMIAFGIDELAQKRRPGFSRLIPAIVVLVFFGILTYHQIGYWRSSDDLWSHTLAVTKNNFIAEDNLGGALILEGKEDEAHAHFEAAARINPRDPMSRLNLGAYFQTHDRVPEAIAQYRAVTQLTSDPTLLAQTYANLGAAYRKFRNDNDEEAQKNFLQSLRLNPRQFNAWLGLGMLARKQGKIEEAISDLEKSIRLQPTAEGYLELGRAYAQAGRTSEALNAYQQALKMSPNLAEAQQAITTLQQSPK